MPQWVVTAHDGGDAEALKRRMAARPKHLEQIAPRVERGEIIIGGALLNEAGEMVGSVSVVEFATQAELDQWLATDPYVTEGVWQRIEVRPFRVAVARK